MGTIEEFKKVFGKEIEGLSEKDILVLFDTCKGLFNLFFEKWKKGKINQIKS